MNPCNKSLEKKPLNKNIAIIGSGVSGLTCAHYLIKEHDVTIFEANDYLGGHVNTIDVTLKSPQRFKKDGNNGIETSSIDTGFIVFNERTYPNFFRLLDELDVPFQKTDMSFSVKNSALNFEYNGHTLNSLLSQRRNVLSPRFWRFAKDIVGFNKHIKQLRQNYQEVEQAVQELETQVANIKSNIITKHKRNKLNKQLEQNKNQLAKLSHETLGDYLAQKSYGKLFQDNYLLPMVSAIWSMGLEDSKAFPLIFFANFFDNHGLLDIVNRPQWFTIKDGSKQYVNKLVARYASLGGKALVNTPVQSVSRNTHKQHDEKGVCISYTNNGITKTAYFDEVIFACHADVAKRLLTDISEQENKVLSTFSFTDNEAILHTDTTVLPNKSLAWASWNYSLPSRMHNKNQEKVTDLKPVLTYHMNILQRLVKKHNYLVTLNESIDDAHVVKRVNYRHPVYNIEVTHAQKQWHTISATDNTHTHFCGAYWFNGFHEDGVRSGVRVCESLGVAIHPIDKVNPIHLKNTLEPNPTFLYKYIPVKADKNIRKLTKRTVISATTNTVLNKLF